jgi:hypothetical protein
MLIGNETSKIRLREFTTIKNITNIKSHGSISSRCVRSCS